MVPVVISTREGREAWLESLFESMETTSHPDRQAYKTIGWEIEAIKGVYLDTDWSEFLFLQDSTKIKDPDFWEIVDSYSGHSYLLMPRPNCYMALYQRDVLDAVFSCSECESDCNSFEIDSKLPFDVQKEWALAFEDWFIRAYIFHATGKTVADGSDLPSMFPELTDARSPRREVVHGELRMVMENRVFVKYKGTFR